MGLKQISEPLLRLQMRRVEARFRHKTLGLILKTSDIALILFQKSCEKFKVRFFYKTYLIFSVKSFKFHFNSCRLVYKFFTSLNNLMKIVVNRETFDKIIIDLTIKLLSHSVESLALIRSQLDRHVFKFQCSEIIYDFHFFEVTLTQVLEKCFFLNS